jgi:DNA-binding protein HU-beta
MNEKELIQGVAKESGVDAESVEKVFHTAIEQMVQSFKNCESVTIKNFGRFYASPGDDDTTIFTFIPSQRLRKIFGWSSTYKGET